MEEIVYCRLCALKKNTCVGIYDDEGHKLNIETKINKCLQIEIYHTDSLPKCVCLDCCFKLDQFSKFMDSSVSAQAALHSLFQNESIIKSDLNNHSSTQLELTALDCNNPYQMIKEFGAEEQISVAQLRAVAPTDSSINEGNNEVTNCNGTSGDVFGDGGGDEDYMDDGIDDDDEDDIDDIDHEEDGSDKYETSDNINNENLPGYVECLLPDKRIEDNLARKRKRSTPVKCFSNNVKLKPRTNVRRKLSQQHHHHHQQQQLHDEEEEEHQQHIHQDIERHNSKLLNGTNNIVVGTQGQLHHSQTDGQHNGVIEFIDCKVGEDNQDDSGDFNEFSNCKDKQFRNENSEPELNADDSKSNGNNKSEWDSLTWVCCDCNKELPTVQELRDHHNIVHKQPVKYMCSQCSKVYTQYHGFFTHVKRHRNLVKYSCEECGKSFSNRKVLDMHLATHSDNRPYVCTVCGKGFRQQSALYIHGRCHLPEEMKNRFACDECDKRFSTKPNLVTHKRIHTGVRNFTCDQCGKSFIQKGNLDAHLLTHSQDKPFSCDLCNKGFKTSMQLRKHHTVHTGAKPHQCDVCGRMFRERGTLREHHRIHTGAMPFTCEFCGKAFRFKGILTTHRRQHTGERPYSCLECQHHFTNWPNYNKHMKRRHGINTSRTSRLKTTSDTTLPLQDQQTPQQQQDPTTEQHVVQQILPDAPPLYEDSISGTPPEDLSNNGQTSAHFYQPAINVTMSAPMTTTYHVAPHPNMLSFYNLTQIQMDPPTLNSVNLNAPVDVIHSVPTVQQQLVHHR